MTKPMDISCHILFRGISSRFLQRRCLCILFLLLHCPGRILFCPACRAVRSSGASGEQAEQQYQNAANISELVFPILNHIFCLSYNFSMFLMPWATPHASLDRVIQSADSLHFTDAFSIAIPIPANARSSASLSPSPKAASSSLHSPR